jgi:hypothetical protein
VRFTTSKEEWSKVVKEINSKEYKKSATEEVKKTGIAVKLNVLWGEFKKERKMLFAFRLDARNPVDYEVFSGAFSPIQRRFDGLLKQYGIEEFEATTCGEFNFSLKAFSPVGQISLPAELPLDPELVNKIGRSTLTGFEISFKNSPLGLEKASLELEEDKNNFSITASSSFRSATKDKIVSNAYGHLAEVVRLFVVKKE